MEAKDFVKLVFPMSPEGRQLSRSGEPRHIIDRLIRIANLFDKFKKLKIKY